MNASQLVSSILKPDLENVFGPAITARIFISARAKANAPIVGMTVDQLMKMVDAISEDERIVAMWGEAGAREITRRWKMVAGSEKAA